MPLIERQDSLSRQLQSGRFSRRAASPPVQSLCGRWGRVRGGEEEASSESPLFPSPVLNIPHYPRHSGLKIRSDDTPGRARNLDDTGNGLGISGLPGMFRAFPAQYEQPGGQPALAANPRSSSLSPIMNVVSGKSPCRSRSSSNMPGRGLRQKQDSSGACGHQTASVKATPYGSKSSSSRFWHATTACSVKYPRPTPDWLDTKKGDAPPEPDSDNAGRRRATGRRRTVPKGNAYPQ